MVDQQIALKVLTLILQGSHGYSDKIDVVVDWS